MLEGDQVRQAASAGYKFRKFARRNKTALRVAAAIFAMLVVSSWQAVRARLAKDRLEQVAAERDQKDQARKDAEAISTFLGEVFQSPDPSRDGRTITVAETLDRAAKKLETDLASQPGHRARLQGILGRTYHALGLYREAIPLLERVRDYVLATRGPAHPDTLNAMHNLAISYHAAGRRDEALKVWEEVLTLSRKVNGPEHPDTLGAMQDLARSYGATGRLDEALKLREEVLTLRRKVNGSEHPETLGAMTNLAVSYDAAGLRADAIELQEQSLAIMRRVPPPNHQYLLEALRHLAELYEKDGRKDDAQALRKEFADSGNPSPPAPAPALETKITVEPKPRPRKPALPGTLVAPDADWKWLHPTDGKDPAESMPEFHTTFFLPNFDDSAWKTSQDSADPDGGFGYGLNFTAVDIGKPDDVKQRHTAYFRHRFATDKKHDNLELRCQRDDGIIVYLDGKEVIRDNVAPGADSWLLPSVTPMDRENDGVIHRHAISGALAPGMHTLAISVHNTAQPSSDLRLGGVSLVEVEAAKK